MPFDAVLGSDINFAKMGVKLMVVVLLCNNHISTTFLDPPRKIELLVPDEALFGSFQFWRFLKMSKKNFEKISEKISENFEKFDNF